MWEILIILIGIAGLWGDKGIFKVDMESIVYVFKLEKIGRI